MGSENKQEYLNKVLELYKNDPSTDELNTVEKTLLRQALSKESKVLELIDESKKVQKEIEEKQKQLQVLEQQVVFERGQMTGIIDSLLGLALETEE